MQQEHRHQAVQQTALTNAINSCRRLVTNPVAGTLPIGQLGGKRISRGPGRRLRPHGF